MWRKLNALGASNTNTSIMELLYDDTDNSFTVNPFPGQHLLSAFK
jgi:hypothetical protein